MKLLKSIFAVTALVFATTAAFAGKGEFADVSVDELHKHIKNNSVVVIDVNGSSSYAKGHIPGAIDFASVKDLKAQLPEDKNTMIVAYCGGPRCMAYKRAATAAKELGYKNVKHLSAGISGWKDAGMPLGKSN